jgi:antitoxin Phd
MGSWAVQDAKARFSEVLTTAEKKGPQIITRRGVEAAVVCPIDEWRRIHAPTAVILPKKVLTHEEFLKFLQSAPDFEIPDRHAERIARRKSRRAGKSLESAK